jgi:hypothetical protein
MRVTVEASTREVRGKKPLMRTISASGVPVLEVKTKPDLAAISKTNMRNF